MNNSNIQPNRFFRALGAHAALVAYPQGSDARLQMQAERAAAFIAQFAASSDAGADVTDIEVDAQVLGLKVAAEANAPAAEQEAYAQLAAAAEALGKTAAILEARRAQQAAFAESVTRVLIGELSEMVKAEAAKGSDTFTVAATINRQGDAPAPFLDIVRECRAKRRAQQQVQAGRASAQP